MILRNGVWMRSKSHERDYVVEKDLQQLCLHLMHLAAMLLPGIGLRPDTMIRYHNSPHVGGGCSVRQRESLEKSLGAGRPL